MHSLQKKCDTHDTLLLIDCDTFNTPPLRKFRIIYNNKKPLASHALPTKGLKKLRASGSAQFTPKHFKTITKKIRKTDNNALIYIIDLRQEYHGFVKTRNKASLPLCWYKSSMNCINWDKERHSIKDAEWEELEQLALQGISQLYIKDTEEWPAFGEPILIAPSKSCSLYVQKVFTEKQLVTQSNAHYKRFYVPDHQAPTHQEIDEFVTFIHSISDDAWLHFHCRAGVGRTTTFLTLYDMLKNAYTVSADDIIKRQSLLSNYDLTDFKKDPIMAKLKKVRLKLLYDFYGYVRAQSPHFTVPFSEWIQHSS